MVPPSWLPALPRPFNETGLWRCLTYWPMVLLSKGLRSLRPLDYAVVRHFSPMVGHQWISATEDLPLRQDWTAASACIVRLMSIAP